MKEVYLRLQQQQRDLDRSHTWKKEHCIFAHHERPTGKRGGEEHRDMEGEEVRHFQNSFASPPRRNNAD